MATRNGSRPVRRWARRFLYLFYVLFLSECGARAYWAFKFQVPFWGMDELPMRRFYPEVARSRALLEEIKSDDETLDVLLLGGSVISTQVGPIDSLLQRQLEELSGRPTRVFNCANVGLNSFDSRWKYERFERQRFDLVLLYESINEGRQNNCPPKMFRADYGHSSWYARIHALERHPELPWLVVPYSIEHTLIGLGDEPRIGWYLPVGRCNLHGWSDRYGGEIKTQAPYRANVTRIVDLARERGATLFLIGYGYHLPDEATIRDYQEQGTWLIAYDVATFWGVGEHVARSIELNNAALREIAAQHDHVLHVDQKGRLPEDNTVFKDPCHLTQRGCEQFVENLRDPLERWLQERPHGDAGIALNDSR